MDRYARFLSHVSQVGHEGGCWLWTGAKNPRGYGWFWNGERAIGAHKYSYEHDHGPVPIGFELDHLCRVPSCVNPAHLEPVLHETNVVRGDSPAAIHAKKSTCPRGHVYDGIDNRGGRYCRTCNGARIKAKRRRVKVEGSPCSRGHALDRQDRRGTRFCSTCIAERNSTNGAKCAGKPRRRRDHANTI